MLQSLQCCSSGQGDLAERPHATHVCNTCGKHFIPEKQKQGVGNPLAALAPVLRGSVLEFLAPSAVASLLHGAALSLLALEPSFLARVACG